MEITVTQKLKSLETRKAKAKAELDLLKEERKRVQSDVSKKEREHDTLTKAIKDICDSEIVTGPIITEHAMLRYLQRCCGLNIEEVNKEILSDQVRDQIKALGQGRYPVTRGDGGTHFIYVKDGKVLTVEV